MRHKFTEWVTRKQRRSNYQILQQKFTLGIWSNNKKVFTGLQEGYHRCNLQSLSAFVMNNKPTLLDVTTITYILDYSNIQKLLTDHNWPRVALLCTNPPYWNLQDKVLSRLGTRSLQSLKKSKKRYETLHMMEPTTYLQYIAQSRALKDWWACWCIPI